ncbi:MAG: hypothetical protein ACRDY3_09430, partial [Acidimicrobiales bacterium]
GGPGGGRAGGRAAPALRVLLAEVLAGHTVPLDDPGDGGEADGSGALPPGVRPADLLAACVHTGEYGTRSSAIVRVPAEESSPPVVEVADGPPCRVPFADRSSLWLAAPGESGWPPPG